ncbi:MAG: VCBS repeat-containing protein, partial [Candidatus Eisenbacteria bacterium]|nr:VCBS repeat-containing protein [Candidatus Eisenbacteria bacterium]
MTRRSKKSPACGLPPRILLITAALCAISPRVADSGFLESMGLDTPFLLGQVDHFTPIDIGGDGVTDLVCAGAAILEGAEVLEGSSPETGDVVHLLRRGPVDGWRHAQSFHVEGTIREIAAGTIDGDERDDILILAGEIGIPSLFLIPFLQSDEGKLVRGPRTDLGGRIWWPEQLSVGFGGTAVFTDWTIAEDESLLKLLSLRYDDRSGFRPLHASIIRLDDLERGSGHLILHDGPNPMVVLWGHYESGSEYRLWTVTQDSTGWRNPSQAIAIDHDPGSLKVVRRDHRSEAWGMTWDWYMPQPRHTLRRLAAAPGTDSLFSRDYPFQPPKNFLCCSENTHFIDLGDSLLFAWATYGPGEYRMLLGTVGPRGASQVGEPWVTWSATLENLLRAPEGGIDLMFSNGAAHCILPSRTLPPPRFELYLDQADEIETRGDFDHDGLDDIVFKGRCGDRTWSYWLLRGRDEPPWFCDPEPIARAERLEVAATADLDGDGFLDLIMRATEPSRIRFVPYFWTGWRFERDEGAAVPRVSSEVMLSDFDGNGRTEVIQFPASKMRICEWGADRRPQEAV